MNADEAVGALDGAGWDIALLRYDADGVCTFATPETLNVLGLDPAGLPGTHLDEQGLGDAYERILLAGERLIRGESECESFTFRRAQDAEDGTPVFLEARCVSDRQAAKGFALAARDVTDRVELELKLARAVREAEIAAQAKSDFLANMSHELRAPMSAALGFAELMLDGELDPVQRHYAEMIAESGRSTMLLLGDILDLSKIEAGLIAIDRAPVDLRATIEGCAAIHRPNAESKGLILDCEFQTPMEAGTGKSDHAQWVLTDGLRLKQIVLNLLGNAVKFTENGRIHIRCGAREGALAVEVSDTGIGISPSRLEQIFHPFTQGDGDSGPVHGGSGLGLSISRRLAELLGGSIAVASTPGAGSCFTLSLPVAIPDPEDIPATRPTESKARPSHRKPLRTARVLLAEDHHLSRELLSEMLARCGQSVTTAHDGNEAISIVIDSVVRDRAFDLVLMDIQMPGCDGYAATRAIRAEGIEPQDLPIIALTNGSFAEEITAAREAGMQGHLAKPVELAKLARTLQRWLPTQIVEASDDEEGAEPDRRAAP